MRAPVIGVIWALAFVILESIQFVFFGNVFQRMNSFLFGAIVFTISVIAFIGWSFRYRPQELRRAFAQPRLMLGINLTATLAWIAFLGSVQLIEPAIAYTIGSGVMPIAAWLAYKLQLPEGEPLRNQAERLGIIIVSVAIIGLGLITLLGQSGFARGDWSTALLGVTLAIADGVFFTWLLMRCQRLSKHDVGAGAVFGLRFPLYILVSAGLFAAGAGIENQTDPADSLWIVAVGLILVVPPLYALQKAVALVPTLTLSAVTATGPFVIFVLQIIEGRVAQSGLTLAGLLIYFTGALLAAYGAMKATASRA